MLQSMQNRLDEIQARYFEIEKLMSQNEIASDPNSIRKLEGNIVNFRHSRLMSDNQSEKNLNETKETIKEETDPEVIEMAREEANYLKKYYYQLKNCLNYYLKMMRIWLMQL